MGSAFSAQTYLDRGYAAEGMITIPYGVDTARFCPAESASERPFRVLFVGQVSLGKGIAYLLQAWKALAWRDAELWLAGNVAPELRPALDGLLAQPGVRVLGYMPRPEEAYRAVDLFCLPSLSEGSALVTYEAMACGLPLVITPEAGAMATHEREALLCPARDASALAEALQCLRDDSALRLRMGQAARRLDAGLLLGALRRASGGAVWAVAGRVEGVRHRWVKDRGRGRWGHCPPLAAWVAVQHRLLGHYAEPWFRARPPPGAVAVARALWHHDLGALLC